MVVVWTDNAKRNLKNIFNYYGEVAGRAVAEKLVSDLVNATTSLATFPEMCRKEPLLAEFTKNFRAKVARKHYKIIYYVSAEAVNIVTVWDCRRNPDDMAKNLGSSE